MSAVDLGHAHAEGRADAVAAVGLPERGKRCCVRRVKRLLATGLGRLDRDTGRAKPALRGLEVRLTPEGADIEGLQRGQARRLCQRFQLTWLGQGEGTALPRGGGDGVGRVLERVEAGHHVEGVVVERQLFQIAKFQSGVGKTLTCNLKERGRSVHARDLCPKIGGEPRHHPDATSRIQKPLLGPDCRLFEICVVGWRALRFPDPAPIRGAGTPDAAIGFTAPVARRGVHGPGHGHFPVRCAGEHRTRVPPLGHNDLPGIRHGQ